MPYASSYRLLPSALCLFLAAAPAIAAEPAQPQSIRALLVTGGCCHDYTAQKKILSEGISARVKVDWTIVHEGGQTTDTKIPLYQNADWSKGFDVVVHNECFAGVTEPAWTERILKPHRDGLPAVLLHCAMHSYRDKTDEWFKFCGVTSHRHGAHYPYEVVNADASHPIMRGFGERWQTPKEELYQVVKVWPATTPLATARSRETKKDEVVVWTNTFGKGRVFGTTIGHYNDTMADPVYLDLVTHGLLWAIGKPDQELRHVEPKAKPAQPEPAPRHGLKEVPHQNVKLEGGFWGQRQKTSNEVTIPHALDELEKDGHVTNFDKAAGKFDGPLRGHHAFDSDLHKALEGAAISLTRYPNEKLRQRTDDIVRRICAAQQKDGFLISYYIVGGLDKRWDDLRLNHQMYNAGHFFEMAAEHTRLTGNSQALDTARRFADHIDSVFGPKKRYDVDGHQEVELALIKLYRATGEQRYFDLARFFLDERGYQHGTERKPFDPATSPRPVKPEGQLTPEQRRAWFHAQLRWRNGRMQDHKPVVDQHEAVGHAVRAGYMYAAMADVARFSDAPEFEQALDKIWNDAVSRKIYITGGVGTGQYDDEGFGDPYLLPNESAYCETCAAIANVLWQHRMALLKGEAKYADMMELSLYNGVLSGVSLSGDHFSYQNPLASRDGRRRSPWIGLSCCPTNICRIVPQVGGLAYAQGKGKVVVNLYAAGEAKMKLDDGVAVQLTQQTDYPWNGNIRLKVEPERATEFDLALRIPGWAQGRPISGDLYRFDEANISAIGLRLNASPIDPLELNPQEDGYVHLTRRWKPGDTVELRLPMPVRRIRAHEKIQADQGKVALMRGPIVYCLEAPDQPGVDLFRLALPRASELRSSYRPDFLGGAAVIEGRATVDGKSVPLTAIPFSTWGNRQRGAMTVWIDEKVDK